MIINIYLHAYHVVHAKSVGTKRHYHVCDGHSRCNALIIYISYLTISYGAVQKVYELTEQEMFGLTSLLP